MEKDIARRMEG
jgi:hypothetical protein